MVSGLCEFCVLKSRCRYICTQIMPWAAHAGPTGLSYSKTGAPVLQMVPGIKSVTGDNAKIFGRNRIAFGYTGIAAMIFFAIKDWCADIIRSADDKRIFPCGKTRAHTIHICNKGGAIAPPDIAQCTKQVVGPQLYQCRPHISSAADQCQANGTDT